MSWTKEQEEMLMMLVKEGRDVNSASEEMIANGYENRTPRSVRAKYRAMTGESWPTSKPVEEHTAIEVEKPEEDVVILEEVKMHLETKEPKSNNVKYAFIGFLSLVIGVIVYWWVY